MDGGERKSPGGLAERIIPAWRCPDGNLILMGGQNNHEAYLNDVWRSTDEGSTWTEVNAESRLDATSILQW